MTSSRVRLAVALAVVLPCAIWPVARAEYPQADSTAEQVKAAIDQIISTSALEGSRAGVIVVSLENGQVLFAHNPDELLNPASNVKLYTTAAALARLGPEYRFATEFYIGSKSDNGTAR